MKLPFFAPSSQTNITSLGGIGSNRFEPKSVLDLQRSPPTPITAKPSEFEEWDSLMNELGLHDDPIKSVHQFDLPDLPLIHSESTAPATSPPLFLQSELENLNPNLNAFDFIGENDDGYNSYNGYGFDFVDELIKIAECFETRSIHLAQLILAQLNQRLHAPTGKAFQRAAFYFKEALQSLLTESTRTSRQSSSSEIVQSIKAYKAFSNVSPIPLFSDFTANQALLEAIDGAAIIHVVDFDIGFGCHWASFMKEAAEKAKIRSVRNVVPPAIRITAVVPEEYEIESKLIRDNLLQFARDLKLRFDIEFVSFHTFDYLSFESIQFINREKTAVLLSSTLFHRITSSSDSGFINDLRRISPDVIVCVDGEGLARSEPSSFRQKVIDGIEFYATVLESLEAANGGGGGGGEWMRRIEMLVLLPKITAAVAAAGRSEPSWREALGKAGLRAVGMSEFGEFQAESLLRRVQVRGYHVVKQQGEMVLCWHDKSLVATSAWRF